MARCPLPQLAGMGELLLGGTSHKNLNTVCSGTTRTNSPSLPPCLSVHLGSLWSVSLLCAALPWPHFLPRLLRLDRGRTVCRGG